MCRSGRRDSSRIIEQRNRAHAYDRLIADGCGRTLLKHRRVIIINHFCLLRRAVDRCSSRVMSNPREKEKERERERERERESIAAVTSDMVTSRDKKGAFIVNLEY